LTLSVTLSVCLYWAAHVSPVRPLSRLAVNFTAGLVIFAAYSQLSCD